MDIPFLTVAELGRSYDKRELSPVEVTRALLDRIAAHDGKLNSFIRVTPEVALAEARASSGYRRGEAFRGNPEQVMRRSLLSWLLSERRKDHPSR